MSHSLIILLDILSQPYALLLSKFFIIRKMSSLLMLREFKCVLVLCFNVGIVLELSTGVTE